MKLKSGLIRTVKLLLFALLLFALLGFLGSLLAHKESVEKYRPFYTAEENFDVLFFGTSHGANGFSPMELWQKYGIVSYNLSQHSEYPAVTYWKVLEALTYADPKLIVVDCYLGGAPDKIPAREDWSYVHKSLDAMPLSALKLRAVMDLIPEWKDRAEFLFPFTMYHNRYDKLTENDFQIDYSVEKGAESRIGTMSLPTPVLIPSTQAGPPSTLDDIISIQYYKKIAEVCEEKDIDLLFAYLPYFTDTASQSGANTMGAWCEQNGIDFVNLLYEDNLIDYQTDMYDYGHLNPAGYEKVNSFLGEYMMNAYHLPDRSGEEAYAHWDEDYVGYVDKLSASLPETDNLFTYLMMLQNPNFSFTLYANAQSGLLANDYMLPFLTNIGVDTAVGEQPEKEALFVIADRRADTMQQYSKEESVSETTSFGEVRYTIKDGSLLEFEIGDSSYTGFLHEKKIFITVYNDLTGQLVDTAVFTLSDGYTRLTDE